MEENRKTKAVFCWSGGKDSAYCLHKILEEKFFDVKYLLTTVNNEFNRISMHGVREELLDLQSGSVGIPVIKVRTGEGTNEEYERMMETALLQLKSEGIMHIIFGDIFLEDLRQYREGNLKKIKMKAVFPLWKMDTSVLVKDFIAKEFKSIVCCTNDAFLGEEWVGREIDQEFLNELSPNVNPCGENGEYHTFCYDGPIFRKKLEIIKGEKIYRPLEIKTTTCNLPSENKTKGFWFIDLMAVRAQH